MKNLLKVKVNCLKCGKEMEEIEREMNYDSDNVLVVEARFLEKDEIEKLDY